MNNFKNLVNAIYGKPDIKALDIPANMLGTGNFYLYDDTERVIAVADSLNEAIEKYKNGGCYIHAA